jgi:predicted acylesterase/phospholipase RssA
MREPRPVSGWRALWQRVNPFHRVEPSPHILNLLTRSSLVASIVSLREKHTRAAASLYLKIPADDVGLLAFNAIDEIAERGYQASRDEIASWWEGCRADEGTR